MTPAAAAAAAPAAAAPAAAALSDQPVLPNPIFEGSEKRVEIDFLPSAATPAAGLRALTRAQLDELMSLAACTIVSYRTNDDLDAYVLSESSLFVYPTKWVLKTCGTTKLLNAVPRLLELADQVLRMAPRRCKYSRASFLFPEQQPAPYRDGFDQEARFLRTHFGHLGRGGSAYVLGDMFHGLQWHVYVADANGAGAAYEPPSGRPFHKFEVCMTDLCREAASAFYRNDAFISAAQTTTDTGIRALVPGADIDDYVFEPCGYSMNGILGGGFITIHITPEDGFSYASVEVSGFDPDAFCPADLLRKVVNIFRPGSLSVSLSVDAASRCGGYAWGALAAAPRGYGVLSATAQELATGGRVSYYTMGPDVTGDVPGGTLGDANSTGSTRCSTPVPDGADVTKAAPRGVLRHMPSFCSLPTASSVDSGSSCGDGGSVASGDEGDGHGAKAAAAAAARAWAKGLELEMKRVRFGDVGSDGGVSGGRSGAASPLASAAAAAAGGAVADV